GDFLIIGNGIRTGPRLVSLETYKAKPFDDWFFGVMKGLGFKRNEVEYDARFANSRIEMFYKIKVNKKINYLGHKIEFKKGDQIVVAILYKYYEDELFNYTKRYFRCVKLFKDPENEYALLVCKK
ncbi:MAG: L-histidine N(alpha)-methyltransferase, partial [Candidatus Pacearchaeota archaeon]